MRTPIILFMAGLLGVGAAATYTIGERYFGDRQDMSDELMAPGAHRNDEPDPALPASNQQLAQADGQALPGSPQAQLDEASGGGGQSVEVCEGSPAVTLGADGRLLNHYPYADTPGSKLASVPAGFGSGNCQLVQSAMLPSLKAMIAAAKKDNPAVGNALMGVSCHRTVARQKGLFCRPDRIASRGIEGQAKWVAPPGYSEHSTGLAIDFGSKTEPQCHVSPCFKDTATGKWLKANAGRFGFEMSFPAGNAQGVSYEPWHFRYINGDSASVFAKARGG